MNEPMTLAIANRPNNATWLMTAAEARGVIIEMEGQVKSVAKRKQMTAFFATNAARKLSDEAVAVYKAYAVKGSL